MWERVGSIAFHQIILHLDSESDWDNMSSSVLFCLQWTKNSIFEVNHDVSHHVSFLWLTESSSPYFSDSDPNATMIHWREEEQWARWSNLSQQFQRWRFVHSMSSQSSIQSLDDKILDHMMISMMSLKSHISSNVIWNLFEPSQSSYKQCVKHNKNHSRIQVIPLNKKKMPKSSRVP